MRRSIEMSFETKEVVEVDASFTWVFFSHHDFSVQRTSRQHLQTYPLWALETAHSTQLQQELKNPFFSILLFVLILFPYLLLNNDGY